MKTVGIGVQAAFVAAGGILGWFLGEPDGLLTTLIAFLAADYLTGIMLAILNKNLCSEIGFRGIFKKVMIFIIVGIAHLLDTQIFHDKSAFRTAVIFFYISNEGISILENASRLGLPVPKKLKEALRILHNKDKTVKAEKKEDDG